MSVAFELKNTYSKSINLKKNERKKKKTIASDTIFATELKIKRAAPQRNVLQKTKQRDAAVTVQSKTDPLPNLCNALTLHNKN